MAEDIPRFKIAVNALNSGGWIARLVKSPTGILGSETMKEAALGKDRQSALAALLRMINKVIGDNERWKWLQEPADFFGKQERGAA